MKFLPIVVLLAVVCLVAVATGKAHDHDDDDHDDDDHDDDDHDDDDDDDDTKKTTTKYMKPVRTTTLRPTTTKRAKKTTSSSKKTSTNQPAKTRTTAGTTAATTTSSTTTAEPSTVSTTTPTTTTPSPNLFNCSVSKPPCGTMCTNLTSTGGVVHSPNFPGDYGNNSMLCIVDITAPAGWMIQLKFTTFNLETNVGYVDACDAYAILMPMTTGNTIPAVVPATTNGMSIRSQYSASSKPITAVYNWRATFSVTSQGSSCSVHDPAGCENMCTNVTSAGSGVVQSPNFPARYPDSYKQCYLTMIVPVGKRIQLTFTTFNLETGKDEITVYDSETKYLSRATGSTIPSVVTARSNKMFINFYFYGSSLSNSPIYNWQATYTAV